VEAEAQLVAAKAGAPEVQERATEAASQKMRPAITVVPEEVMAIILDRLSPATALAASAVCRSWRALARDEAHWSRRYAQLVVGKLYVGPQVAAEPSNLRRFFSALRDCCRTSLTAEEVTRFGWCMRFKSEIGPHMKALDPWWNGEYPGSDGAGECLKLKLRPDGAIIPLAPAMSPFWGAAGSEAGRWEYRLHPDFGCAEVRVNGFPSYLVSRHPEHWGVYMHNTHVIWTAFPMPPRAPHREADLLLEDAALAAAVGEDATSYMRFQRRRYEGLGNVLGFEY
jgi:hypothetical protein